MGVESSVFVIPFQFNSDKQFALSVDCDIIVFGQCLDQMICVDVATYFYAEVGSTSPALHLLVIRFHQLEMVYGIIVHLIHVSGS